MASSNSMESEEEIVSSSEDEVCYICLSDAPPLVHPCSCPRVVHTACLAKWQLNCAGKDEETRCRFCDNVLPDWRPALTPSALKPASSVMSVRYRGVTHRITYTPGPDGLQHFLETLQGIGIKVASASQVTFLCRSPDTGEEMSLKGLKAFDAAAYCASITAAKRAMRDADKKQRRRAAQQQQQQQAAAQRQQQQAAGGRDTSPGSDHHAGADMGVRPEAGPDSPRSPGRCEGRQVAHVHAEAHDQQQQQAAHAHHHHHHLSWFGGGGGGSAAAAAPPATGSSRSSLPGDTHHLEQGEEWWRRALARMHIHVHERRHSAG